MVIGELVSLCSFTPSGGFKWTNCVTCKGAIGGDYDINVAAISAKAPVLAYKDGVMKAMTSGFTVSLTQVAMTSFLSSGITWITMGGDGAFYIDGNLLVNGKPIAFISVGATDGLATVLFADNTSTQDQTAVVTAPIEHAIHRIHSVLYFNSAQDALLTINGVNQTPSAYPLELARGANYATVTGTVPPRTLTADIDRAAVTINGQPVVSGQSAPITGDIALVATGNSYSITPTIGNDMTVSIGGTELATGTPVTVSADTTLTAVNTKITPAITFSFGEGVTVTVNEVTAVSGQSYPLSNNAAISITAEDKASDIEITYTGLDSMTLDGDNVVSGTTVNLTPGSHILNATGSTSIPKVEVNGEGISSFTVNGAMYTPDSLPYSFTPQGGRVNQIYVNGQDTAQRTLTVTGTHISSMTVNGVETKLPYTVTVTEPLTIAVSGETYQLDVSSAGGAIIKRGSTVLSDGSSLHSIIDITEDTFLSVDGTHRLTVSGTDLKTITINGVVVDVKDLPVDVTNNSMTASVVIGGYPPSEIHVTGQYIDTASLDGTPVTIGANGSIALEVEVRDENHYLSIVGSQPRDYNLTFDTNGTTIIAMDGVNVPDGSVIPIRNDKFISALPQPVPVNFDADALALVKVDGVTYTGEFGVNVSRTTNVEINSTSCTLTIDYGDNSYQVVVPQRIVTLTAPHRDGWIFDTWTSNDVGIINPRMVQCNIDLSGKATAHIVANYQRYITCDKPNPWN